MLVVSRSGRHCYSVEPLFTDTWSIVLVELGHETHGQPPVPYKPCIYIPCVQLSYTMDLRLGSRTHICSVPEWQARPAKSAHPDGPASPCYLAPIACGSTAGWLSLSCLFRSPNNIWFVSYKYTYNFHSWNIHKSGMRYPLKLKI